MDEQNENKQPGGVSSSSPPPMSSEAESVAPEPSLSRIPSASRGNRVQTIITLSVLVIVVLVILGTLTPLKNIVTQRASSPSPTPVATIAPGDNKFYIATGPAWGTVSVDGHPLAHLPVFGKDKPLQLARGAHIISWHADPFQSESCTVYVPSLFREPCPYEDTSTGGPRIIEFTASLANLSASQRASLVTAAQVALNKFQTTTTVQPGEQYAEYVPPQAVGTGTAQQALQATEHFFVDANPSTNRSCNIYSGVTCSEGIGSGNSCIQFCTFTNAFEPGGVLPGATSSSTWETMGLFYPSWDYNTQGGQTVAKGQPDTTLLANASNDYAILFDIQWTDQKWHVSVNSSSSSMFVSPGPVSQPNPACQSIHDKATQVLDGCLTLDTNYLGCVSLQALTSSVNLYTTTQDTSRTPVNWNYLTGQDVADGCVAVIVPQQQSSLPTSAPPVAYCLYRFGVLLAANALAHRYWPDLPMADAYEQQIAQQVAASAHL